MPTYTLFNQTSLSVSGFSGQYTLGVQFITAFTSTCTLDAIWFYSPTNATILPTTIALYNASGTLVASQAASWSGAAASGWVKAPFTSPPSLTAAINYVACVFQGADAASDWYTGTSSYWTTGGGGASGITNGPLSAPNESGSVNGQDIYNSGTTLGFPNTDSSSQNYWVDPEVTVTAPPPQKQLPNFPVVIAANSGWRNAGHSR